MSGSTSKKESLGNGLSSLHHTASRLLSFKKTEFDTIELFKSSFKQSLSDPSDQTYKMAVIRAYTRLHEHHQLFTDEERLISRMERRSQIRNTFFRAITTLSIGFSVMFVYWAASKWDVVMPFMRIPL